MIFRSFSRGNRDVEPNINYQEASGRSVNISELNINVFRNANKKIKLCIVPAYMYTVPLCVPWIVSFVRLYLVLAINGCSLLFIFINYHFDIYLE